MPSTVIPCLVYRDAPSMIDWLCEVVGFARHAVYPDEQGGIAHAELVIGDGMIMLGSINEKDFSRIQSTPEALGGTTQSPYLVVEDADAVYARAIANGATIVIDIKNESYGGRGFTFLDPEGHLWNVGTYDPWAKPEPA